MSRRLTDAQHEERRRKAGRLRAEGASWTEIKAACGLVSERNARDVVRSAVTCGYVRAGDLPPDTCRPAASGRWKTRAFTAPPQPRDWRELAICREVDPEIFYGHGYDWSSPANQARAERAKAFCRSGCPVLTECLVEAIAAGDPWSVRGGTTPDERADMQQPRRSA